MIAVDTNLLIYAHRADSPWHDAARTTVADVARERWALPWPCVHEFIAIVTHPRVFSPPSTLVDALRAARGWLQHPTTVALAESEGYWDVLERLLDRSKVTGPKVHDTRIAALCLHHGVSELLTADRDFSRFPELRTRNPLQGAG